MTLITSPYSPRKFALCPRGRKAITESIEASHRVLAEQKLAWDRQRRATAHAWGQARDTAAAQMRPLLDQALASGTALPVQ